MILPAAAPFAAAVLAGGRSSRMGRDKALLEVYGQRLIDRQLDTLRALGPRQLLISGRAGADYAVPDARMVYDAEPDRGPLGGLMAVMAAAVESNIVVLAVDLPAMTPEFLLRLCAAAHDGAGCVPIVAGHWEPLAAIYPQRLLARARKDWAAGERSLQPLITAAVAAGDLHPYVVAPAELPLLANWNAATDWSPGSTR